VLNGSKRWCTGADFADYIYCLVRTDDGQARYHNLSFVLVPKGTPGVTVTPIDHVSLRYTLSSDVVFEDAEISSDLIVGEEAGWNRGWPMLAGEALDVEKLEITAMTFGLAKAAVADAWRYSQERVQFGKPISGHQAVRHALVDAKTKLQACEHMLYHATCLADRREPFSVEASMAKLFIAETAVDIAITCQRVMGAYALSADYDMERYVRDLLGMPIVGGSSNMQRNNIAKRLGLAG
jgi:alkylation response protein AidB-like acyl-CoA dehydrogenase